MWLLFLEALVAMFLLIFIVWWTMFAGKKTAVPKPAASSLPQEKAPDGGARE